MSDEEKIVDVNPLPLPDQQGHRWNPYPIASDSMRDGYERTIRECLLCDVLKITIHGHGKAWREWCNKDGRYSKKRPQCEGEDEDRGDAAGAVVHVVGETGQGAGSTG